MADKNTVRLFDELWTIKGTDAREHCDGIIIPRRFRAGSEDK